MMKYNENGRSMVEMLGVLAIIGVLSVGGIAGYSKAMNKYKINKTTDQVSMLVANIRTLFSSQGNYKGLNNGQAIKFGVVPNDMYTPANTYADNYSITNAFSGDVTIEADVARKDRTEKEAFVITYAGLSDEACVTVATGDWGSGQASGLIGIAAGKSGVTDGVKGVFVDSNTAAVAPTDKATVSIAAPGAANSTPMSVTNAVAVCSGGGSGNSVAWKYY
ncbi:MAG: type 4 pilus major pilin [Alphaproteobacteria bacterium]|nr:type 4 pilus major pilin [Alphaproteobacteria bacterium]